MKDSTYNYSSEQVVEYLQRKGYDFDISSRDNSSEKIIIKDKTVYVSNSENSICFQKIYNSLIGIDYLWQNDDINKSWANIKTEYENEKIEEKKQFSEYEKWLEYLGLTSDQIIDALDYYFEVGVDNNTKLDELRLNDTDYNKIIKILKNQGYEFSTTRDVNSTFETKTIRITKNQFVFMFLLLIMKIARTVLIIPGKMII